MTIKKDENDGSWWRKVTTFGDLQGLSVGMALEIMKDCGVQFEEVPQVELGNLSETNLHINYLSEDGEFEGHTVDKEGKFDSFFPFGLSRETKLDKFLVITHYRKHDSLLRYAKSIKEEYADLSNEKLLNYTSLGRKRYLRARDECLRRGLIKKVDEIK